MKETTKKRIGAILEKECLNYDSNAILLVETLMEEKELKEWIKSVDFYNLFVTEHFIGSIQEFAIHEILCKFAKNINFHNIEGLFKSAVKTIDTSKHCRQYLINKYILVYTATNHPSASSEYQLLARLNNMGIEVISPMKSMNNKKVCFDKHMKPKDLYAEVVKFIQFRIQENNKKNQFISISEIETMVRDCFTLNEALLDDKSLHLKKVGNTVAKSMSFKSSDIYELADGYCSKYIGESMENEDYNIV